MKTKHTILALGGGLAAAVAATPALAHPGHPGEGLVAGLSHPLMGADHLLAMLAVGLWSATRAAGKAWQAPATFLAMLALGGVLGVAFGAQAAMEPLLAGSLVGLAALLLAAPFVGNRLGLTQIGVFALLHGLAHGGEAAGSLPAYFAGFLAMSAVLHLAGWRIGRALFVAPALRWMTGAGIGAAGLAMALS